MSVFYIGKARFFMFLLLLVSLFVRCNAEEKPTAIYTSAEPLISSVNLKTDTFPDFYMFFSFNPEFMSDGFDYPVGKPDGEGYYNAQSFGKNNHLGDDWNGTGGGNSDLGDPVYAAANGYVSQVYDAGGGWGNVVRIIHKLSDTTFTETLYAHLETMTVSEGVGIKKGEKLGTIGTANGAYLAHLHFELRTKIGMPLGGGYSSQTTGYTDPTKYINKHRKVLWKMAPEPD